MARVDIKTGRGRKTCDAIVAHLPGVKAELELTTRIGAAKAKAKLAAHGHGPAPHSRITVTHGKLDWFINLVDPDGAAAAVEFGRLQGGHGTTRGVGALSAAF